MKCQQHNQPVSEIILDTNLKKEQRLICLKCQKKYEYSNTNVIKILEAKQIAINKFGQLLPECQLIQLQIQQTLENFKQNIIQLKKDSLTYLEVLLNYVNEWQLELIDIFNIKLDDMFLEQFDEMQQTPNNWKKKKSFKIAQELQVKYSTNSLKIQEQITIFQDLSKIYNIQKDLQEIEISCNQVQKNMNFQYQQQNLESVQLNPQNKDSIYYEQDQTQSQCGKITNIVLEQQQDKSNRNQTEQQNLIQCSLIDNKIKSENSCFALAFNKDSNIVISGDKGNIKIWEFNRESYIIKIR